MTFDPYALAAPLLRRLDAENAHRLALHALRSGFAGRFYPPAADPAVLETCLWGHTFSNPVGLAAGFDKNGEAIAPLLRLGFGFIEIGGVTPRPQPGNPRPRLFRLPEDDGVINRMGFNNDGAAVVAERLAAVRRNGGFVGVNLGKNKDSADAAADYAAGARIFAPLADFLVVNVSSPNTPGLRALQSVEPLREILSAVLTAAGPNGPPILLKVAPDLGDEDLGAAVELAIALHLHGLIVGNTTLSRPESLRSAHRTETGGLSGRPLFALSTAVLRRAYKIAAGRIPLVGVGGIASGADAYVKIRSGAALLQLYSALVFQGPGLLARLKADLAALLARDGFTRLTDAVGVDA